MRRAMLLLIALTGLCSCNARPALPPVMVVHVSAICPAPVRPDLPVIDPDAALDSPANVERLMERDDLLRQYIKGLESTVECYKAQTMGKED